MKRIILFILQSCVFLVFTVTGQKLNIDRDFSGEWQLASVGKVSPNGQYICYTIPNNHNGIFVSSVAGAWKMEFSGISYPEFSANNKQLLFKRGPDSLFCLKLGTTRIDFIARCKSFQLVSIDGTEWLLYETRNANKELVLRNMLSGKDSHYLHVLDYKFSPVSSTLVLKTEEESESGVIQMKWVKLPGEKAITIWEGKIISDYVFDQRGTQLAFIAKDTTSDLNVVWYYSAELPHPLPVVSQSNIGIEKGLVISEAAPAFNGDGNVIFFELQKFEQEAKVPEKVGVEVDVWSYSDHKLQSGQAYDLQQHQPPVKNFVAVVNIKSKKVLQIRHDGEHILQGLKEQKGGFILLASDNDGGAWWTNSQYKSSFYLTSIYDNSRKLLFKGCYYIGTSPNGKYIVWFDSEKDTLYGYNSEDGSTKNLSSSIPVSLKDQDWDTPGNVRPAGGNAVLAWFKNDEAFLIQDNFDIWQIDPTARRSAVNITNGYGRSHHTRFMLETATSPALGLDMKGKLLLTAFDRKTKYSGFFSKQLGSPGDPELLTMGPYEYRVVEQYGRTASLKQKQNWVVRRMGDVEAPDYFWTRDFKTFGRITDVQPQLKYSWLKAELLNYQLPDGTASQAILYKPEDFDSTKKYPVLFNYYEKKSDDLYKYLVPEPTWQEINIPYFVSHGYLVVLPDMYYKVGSAGDGAVQSIVGAVDYLAKFSFVDTTKMGIDGCSWGGYETNYIITHTNLFAAAAEMAGASDVVSQANDITLDGHSVYMQSLWQYRVGKPFGEAPELYIKNSPIFNVSQVMTPLLIAHNKDDYAVPWKQGVEFYMALRNSNKRVWMLQYDNGGHSINPGSKDAQDYTIRLTQFYDHYLKEAPAPVWMTKGIPASLKGIETGYDLDPTNSCGKDCKVCKKWNEASAAGQDKIKKIGNDYEIRSE